MDREKLLALVQKWRIEAETLDHTPSGHPCADERIAQGESVSRCADELEAALGDAAPTPCPKCGSYNMTIRCHLGERLRTACSRCGHEREAAPKEDATRA